MKATLRKQLNAELERSRKYIHGSINGLPQGVRYVQSMYPFLVSYYLADGANKALTLNVRLSADSLVQAEATLTHHLSQQLELSHTGLPTDVPTQQMIAKLRQVGFYIKAGLCSGRGGYATNIVGSAITYLKDPTLALRDYYIWLGKYPREALAMASPTMQRDYMHLQECILDITNCYEAEPHVIAAATKLAQRSVRNEYSHSKHIAA